MDGKEIGFYHWDIDNSKTPPELHTGRNKDFPEGTVTKMELSATTLILTTTDPNNLIKVIFKHP